MQLMVVSLAKSTENGTEMKPIVLITIVAKRCSAHDEIETWGHITELKMCTWTKNPNFVSCV